MLLVFTFQWQSKLVKFNYFHPIIFQTVYCAMPGNAHIRHRWFKHIVDWGIALGSAWSSQPLDPGFEPPVESMLDRCFIDLIAEATCCSNYPSIQKYRTKANNLIWIELMLSKCHCDVT